MTTNELINFFSKKELEIITDIIMKFISTNDISNTGITISKSKTKLEEYVIKYDVNVKFNGKQDPNINSITFEFLDMIINVPYDTLKYLVRQYKLDILLK